MYGRFATPPGSLEQRCSTFVQFQAWPLLQQLNWQMWLTNFADGDEQFFARCLLEGFVYFNGVHSDALFRAAFHGLSREVCNLGTDAIARTALWTRFTDRVVLSYVEGEEPSPTDSGLAFARRARNLFEIPDDRIVSPTRALELVTSDNSLPVVFVDDFLGSGKQFEATWRRERATNPVSFAALAGSVPRDELQVWYIPLLASDYGVHRVSPMTEGAKIRPTHAITSRYSARSDDSLIWPEGRHQAGRDFVESVSVRAGYSVAECWGFHRLGLCVAILDTVPDATLPLFHSSRNGWHPLMTRRA